MATAKKTAPAETSPSGYWRVTVDRAMPDVLGETFRPGVEYTVAQIVLDALGDAVATKTAMASVVRAPTEA